MDNRVLAAVFLVHWCYHISTGSLCLDILQGSHHQMWAQLAKGASPPLPAEMMQSWGNQSRAVSRSLLSDTPQKPKKQTQSSFAPVRNNLPRGRESPE